MKHLFLVLFAALLLAGQATAQTDFYDKRVRAKMWESNNPDTKVTEVPAKWANESAVILYKNVDYSVEKEILLDFMYENLDTHFRIKLLDKAAVQEFSQLAFDNSKSYQYGGVYGNNTNFYLGIKVIKPNGKETEVDIDNTALMEIKQGYAKKQYKKIAVPDLEPGDIVDYYYSVRRGFRVGKFNAMDPVLYILTAEYPILKQRIDLHIQRKCYLNARSVNGAPELKLADDSKKSDMLYTLIDTDREKADDKRWSYQYRSLPTLKFQTFFASSKSIANQTVYKSFMGKQGVMKTGVTDKELLSFVNDNLTVWTGTGAKIFLWTYKVLSFDFSPIDKTMSREILMHLNRKHKNLTDPEKIAKEAYYYYRQKSYASNYENEVLYDSEPKQGVSDYFFVRNMSRVLEKKKIDHDIILTTSRSVSTIDELVLPAELGLAIRVNTKKPFYITNFSRFSNYNELDVNYQGNKALAVSMQKSKKLRNIKQVTLPVSSHEENTDELLVETQFDAEEPTQLLVTRSATYKGANRYEEMNLLLTPYDYIEASKKKNDLYNIKPAAEQAKTQKKKAEVLSRIEQRKEQDQQARKEDLKKNLENYYSFKVLNIDDIKVMQTGFWDDAPAFSNSDSFKVEGLVSKIGPNLMLDAGKLIGGQLALQKNEMERHQNIFMPFARSFNHTIRIAIPEGYEPKGLEKLNYNVTNQTGGFVSTAAVEGSTIVIKAQKYYSSNYEQSSAWAQLVSFLEASYDFSQQKILFQKL